MRNRLDRLRHDTVVGGHDQHGDICDLRAASAHGSERLVAWRVQEDDAPAFLLDDVGADALGDPTGFAGGHLGLADGVEQRRLSVVDVPHDGDHRRSDLQVLGSLAIGAEELRARGELDLGGFTLADHLFGDRRIHRHRAGLDPKTVGDDGRRVEIDLLVDVRHHTVLHQLFDDVDRLDVQVFRQLLDGECRRQLHLAFGNRLLGLGGLTSRELGAHGRLLLRRQHRHGVAWCVARWAQEIEDIPGLDAEVAGELLNLDTASRCSYE